jgi:hypothetical protein
VGQAPGWYDDLFVRDQERYWDGRVWTWYIRPVGSDDPGPYAATAEDDPFAAVSLEAGVAPPKPKLRRRLRRAWFSGAAVVLVVALLAGAGVYVFGHHSEAAATEAVTKAASQSLDAKSADMSFTMTFSGPGLNEKVTGQGAFDYANQIGTMTVNLPLGGPELSEQVIEAGGTLYIDVGNLLSQAAPGKSWVSATESQLSNGGSQFGGGFSQWDDPSAMLQQLQNAGATVTSNGQTTFDGTPVTAYSVTLPSTALQQYLGSLPSSVQHTTSGLSLPNLTETVYVESGNLLRGVDLPFSFGVMGQNFSMDMQMQFSNYGTPVNVTPPPASEVIPYSQFGAIAGTGNSGNSGSLGNSGGSGTI